MLHVGRVLQLLCLLIRVLVPLGDPWVPTITSGCCEGAGLVGEVVPSLQGVLVRMGQVKPDSVSSSSWCCQL